MLFEGPMELFAGFDKTPALMLDSISFLMVATFAIMP